MAEVLLTDMSGKTVRRYEVSSDYSLEGIAAGAYFVRVLMADNSVVTKTIVVRQ
jgi:hypothetical protein